jgi:manganese-dependent inorganic pyrophosphatase
MSEVKVIGHINPDTDSTVSPIVYAWYETTHENLPSKAYLAGEPNKEALYVLERFGFEKPEIISEFQEGDKIIVIDTNNPEELIKGHDKAEIIEIIDHHKLSGLSTPAPVKITIKPVACVATILWKLFKMHGHAEIPGNVAGMLLSAILSDTLKFTSPTTTDQDKDAASELAKIANVEIDELADKMFAAKSDLTGMSPRDILHVDSKIFELAGKKLRISVLETTKPDNALAMIEEIKNTMREVKNEEKLDGVLFYVVDIINTCSTAIAIDDFEKETLAKAHGVEMTSDRVMLPKVVSRKKQIVPNIEKALS